MARSIHPDTTIGAVYLTVTDLDRALAFYQDPIGFQVNRHEGNMAYLGVGGRDLLVLTGRPDAGRARDTTGLYHFAILTPSRLALARSLRRLAETQTSLQGFADHLVSEAIYRADPDGNGIEIYRDRPRSEWPRLNGDLQMASDPLDFDGIMAELKHDDRPWNGLEPETVIGHVHLHVADLDAAGAFYRGVIGFDLMARLGHSAEFVSAGGYHHHLGYNTWAGVGAPPPPADAVGLRFFEVCLPDEKSLDEVVGRARAAKVSIEEWPEGVIARDPSQNGVLLTTAT